MKCSNWERNAIIQLRSEVICYYIYKLNYLPPWQRTFLKIWFYTVGFNYCSDIYLVYLLCTSFHSVLPFSEPIPIWHYFAIEHQCDFLTY